MIKPEPVSVCTPPSNMISIKIIDFNYKKLTIAETAIIRYRNEYTQRKTYK